MSGNDVTLSKVTVDKIVSLEAQLMSARKITNAMRIVLLEVESQIRLVEDELHILYTR